MECPNCWYPEQVMRFGAWCAWLTVVALALGMGLPSQSGAQEKPADEFNLRAATLTPGEEWSDILSLEEAEEVREQFRAAAAGAAPRTTVGHTVPFEWLFQDGPGLSRDRYASTRRAPTTPLEEHLRSLDRHVRFTEEVHCMAQHMARAQSFAGIMVYSVLRYQPMAQCGLAAGRPNVLASFQVSDAWFQVCQQAGIEGADDPWLCAVHNGYQLPSLPDDMTGTRVMGVGMYPATGFTQVAVIYMDGLPDMAPIDRVLDENTTHILLRLRNRHEEASATYTVVDGLPTHRCHETGDQPGRRWHCPLPQDADTLNVQFYWLSDASTFDNRVTVHRSPPPLVPPPTDICTGREVAPHEITADVVREWINAERNAHGLPPLTATAEHDEWISLIRRFGTGSQIWELPATGLAFDGLIAADYSFSPLLYSDEPCRELMHLLTLSPELATMVYSPLATHMAVGTQLQPNELPGILLLLHLVEADSPDYRAAIGATMQALLEEHHPQSLNRSLRQQQTPAMILGNLRNVIEMNGEDIERVVLTFYIGSVMLRAQGGQRLILDVVDLTSPTTLTWPAWQAMDGMGSMYEVVRRPQFRVNRTVYHVLWMQFSAD